MEEVSWWEIDVGPRGWGDELGDFFKKHILFIYLG